MIMRQFGLFFIIALIFLAGSAWGDKLLTIEGRQTIEDDPGAPDPPRAFWSGRAQERFLDLNRDNPFSLPKAALPAGLVDTITIVAIRVDFTYEDPDDPTTTGRGTFDLRDTATFLAQEGHALDPGPHNRHYFEAHLRSMTQYWKIVSNGKLQLVYEVWPQASDSAYHLGKSISHYGGQEPAFGLGELFHDALDAAHEAEGDGLWFRDDRGRRKAIMIFHAGADRQTDLWFSYTPTPNDLFTGFLTFDGPNRWFMDPDTTVIGEDIVITGRDTIVEGIILPETMVQDNRVTVMNAVMAHEFGHQLGLVDLYSTGTSPFMTQMGDFALMDNMGMNTAAYLGEYGLGAFGTVPLFPMAWSRAYLGFDEVAEYTQGTSIELAAVKMQTEGVKIAKIPISSTEYYLLENRRSDLDGPVGLRQDSTSNVILWPARYDPDGDSIMALPEYDLYLPIGSAGMAIWHIDEMVAAMDYFPFDIFDNNFDGNTVQWDPNRRFISLVEADGEIDFGGNYYTGFGKPIDLFYEGNNTAFGSYTNPPTISNDGGYTHIEIDNISAHGMIMTFDLNQDKMAGIFPRRISIPTDPGLSAIAADLDGDGDDEIISVSGKKVLAMTSDGRSYIDPDGIWDTDPRNIDTIFSAIQSVTDAHSGKPVDTGYALMPVFADVLGNVTAPPVVASFNDTTVVLVGIDGGLIYSFLPTRNAPDDGRAQLFKVRATPAAGDVLAIIPDEANNLIHALYANGQWAWAAWDAAGQVSAFRQFEGSIIGSCSFGQDYAFLFEGDGFSTLYLIRNILPDGWSVVDSVVIDEIDFHTPVATDFDRDGLAEIILLSRTGHIFSFTGDETGLIPYESLYDFYTDDTAAAGPSVGDISGDGFPELIIPGTNQIYGFDRHGISATDFPLSIDYGSPGQLVITQPVISDITGDNFPDIVVSTFDSLPLWKSVALYYIFYPDTINYPDSFIVIDTTLDYSYFNYYSTVHVVSPGISRIEGFPVSAGAYAIRQPGDTVIGAGTALHLKDGNRGLLVTTGASGWMNAWECEWSSGAAWWPMAARTPDGSGYLSLQELGEETTLSDFLPETKFYNYPNPATGERTWIRFYVNQPASITLTIIDAMGDEIWEIQEDVIDGNSENEIAWDLSDIASGVYHCRLEAVSLSGSESKVAFKTIAVVK
jgi:M6 family metalloprotease-like protein